LLSFAILYLIWGIAMLLGIGLGGSRLRHFRRALLVSSAALVLAPVSSFAQNLIQNPGFETNGCGGPPGQCSGAPPWLLSGAVDITSGVGNGGGNGSPYALNPYGSSTTTQTVTLANAGNYRFSFFYAANAGGGPLTVTVGGNTVFNATINNASYLQSISNLFLPVGVATVSFASGAGGYEFNIDDVSLTLLQNFLLKLLPPNAPINPTNVAAAIDAFTVAGGTLPAGFQSLSNLTPQQLSSALSQISGELGTGAQQTTFDAMTQFMGVMTDPFIGGRGDGMTAGSGTTAFAQVDGANAYAAKDPARTKSESDAYAAIYRKAPAVAAPFNPGWSVWAAGFGGSQTTNGNTAVGSNSATSGLGAVAVGADYRFSPNTIAGFALAGGGTNFSVNGLGSGRSDLFQAGAFVRHTVGPAYFTAALAYGWQDITTDRTVTVAGIDQLRARFNANAYSGRIEDGYRFVTPWMGVTPYAAGQFTTFDLPAYAEQAVVGANTFALAYGGKSVTAPRSEVGIRTDRSWALPDSIFTLRGRFAWAHDYDTDRSIGATFQTLPGASFVVNGAAQSAEKALTTASAEVKWPSGISLAATFEGEFSNNSTSYAGKGVARYQW
jgi:uncharacterized protein with beta-barrel porin domain